MYKQGIDLCCNSQITVKQAIDDHNVNINLLESGINTKQHYNFNSASDYNSLSLDQLMEIINVDFHRYIESNMQLVYESAKKALTELKDEGFRFVEIVNELEKLKTTINNYLFKAIHFLFPYIQNINEAYTNNVKIELPKEIKAGEGHYQLEKVHEQIHSHLHKLRSLVNKYLATETLNGVTTKIFEKILFLNFKLSTLMVLEINYLMPRVQQIEHIVTT